MALIGGDRRLLVPTATTAVFIALLLGLGVWQLYRLRWKEGILAQVARSEAAPPVPLAGTPPRFSRVIVSGRFDPGFAALYGDSTRDGRTGLVLGADVLALLLRDGAPPLLVDRGWVAAPVHGRAPPPPAGEVTVVGYVTGPDPGGPFTPRDDPAAGRVYALNPARIAAEFHLPAPAPLVLVAMGKVPAGPVAASGGAPLPAEHLPRPPNNHLEYAMTWFALAVAAGIVYVTYIQKIPDPKKPRS